MKVDTSIVIRRYIQEGDDFEEVQDFLAVEGGDGEVDVHLSPATSEVVTFSLTTEQAWNMARELMRAATVVEEQD